MTQVKADFAPFAQRMRAEGLPEIVIRNFEFYYQQLAEGRTGLIPEADIQPVEALPDADAFGEALVATGKAALAKTVLCKLNGGLGTSMGLSRAKSLLIAKGDLSFLDIIARQALRAGVPLLLMNSFNTRAASLAVLANYPELAGKLPLDFTQHKVPRVRQDDLTPVVWPADRELEWCPPGHGDIYLALVTSGILERLLDAGYEYAFVSNADNLGAVLDPAILGYFVTQRLSFLMEVADRSAVDRKGGHLARRVSDGQLLLRELAQCPAEDQDAFQDIAKYRYFNTNNLWLHLATLRDLLEIQHGLLGLPMIRNCKPLDPCDPSSPPVYQLETAMGAAISLFAGAGAVRVPRTRFAPVKTTDDLLAIRSDAFVLTEDYRIAPNPARALREAPIIRLDPRFYRVIDDMEARFPYGAPSLVACQRLTVRGDVRFGRGIVCRDVVEVVNDTDVQATVADGDVLSGECRLRGRT